MALDKLTKLTSNSGISTVIDYTMSDLIVDSINIAGGGTTLGKDFETRNLKVTGLSTFVGNVQMDGNLTVNGTTTTLDTNLIGVDRVEVVANDNNYAGIAVTQSGTGDIISAYDGSTQVFVVSDGNRVGIADSIYHLGDDNTAFGFPSADTFKIDTAGAERLRITSAGELQAQRDYAAVGINTFAKFTRTGGGGPHLEIGYNAVTTDYGYFGTGSVHDLGLRTNDITRLRIDTSGNVDIATGHLSLDNDKGIFFDGTTTTKDTIWRNSSENSLNMGSRYHMNLFIDSNNDDTNAYFAVNKDHTTKASATELFRVQSDGKVGVGTDNPQDTLDVANNVPQIRLTDLSDGSYGQVRANGGHIILRADEGNTVADSLILAEIDGNEKVRITSTGIVSINDSTPESWAALQVKNHTTSNAAQVIIHGADMAQIIMRDDTGGSNQKCTTLRNDEGTLKIGTHNDAWSGFSEKLSITPDGDIAINQSGVIDNAKLSIKCDATQPAIGVQANHTNTDTKLISAWNSGGKNIVNITAESDNSPYVKFEILSGNSPVERFRVTHLGNVAIGGGTAGSNRLEIIGDHKGFVADSAQPNATLLIKHGTSGTDRRWIGIGASTTGAWLQSSSPGGSGLSAPIAINPGGGKVGINSTNPQHNLDVKGNARVHNADPALYLQSYNNASNTCLIRMGDTGSFQRASISYDLSSGFMMWKLGGAGNNIEHMRYDGANNRLHIGKRDGNSNSTHWSTARVSIVGPDPIATSVSKAASYLAIGNNESELNGVYPITFGYTNNSNSHQPAYIAYKTTNAGSAECGDLLFATRNVITDTAPTERLRITSGGQLVQTTTHTSGNSAHYNTSWYGDDANHYDIEVNDFNEVYAVKTENANNYSAIVYKREKMTEYCDIEFTMTCNAPHGTTYRHLGFAINGDGSDTWSNMDRLVVRHRPNNTNNNQVRIDKGGGGYGFNSTSSSYPNFADGTERHWHIQIRKRTFVVTVDGSLVGSFRSDADLVRSHGFFGFCLYEAATGSNNPSVRIRDFKIRNHTAQAIPGNSVAFQASIATGNPSKSSGYVVKPANDEHFDNGYGGGNYNTSNYRFTAPVAGVYYFRQTMNVYTSPNNFFCSIRINGSTQYAGQKSNTGWGSGDTNVTASCLVQLEKGDYAEALDNTGNGVTYSSGKMWNRFEGHLVAAYK